MICMFFFHTWDVSASSAARTDGGLMVQLAGDSNCPDPTARLLEVK